MSDAGLLLLKKSLIHWLDGKEDFGVSPRYGVSTAKALGKLDKESGEIWFWGPGYSGPQTSYAKRGEQTYHRFRIPTGQINASFRLASIS